jgi:hypothetical protein
VPANRKARRKHLKRASAPPRREPAKPADPFGPENEVYLLGARDVSVLTVLVLGWGAQIADRRLREFYKRVACCVITQKPNCFGVTKNGDPRHPLYLKGDVPLVPWKMPS